MADISMCPNNNCPSRGICYRYKAKAGPRQAFMWFAPDSRGWCDDFIQMKATEEEAR